MKDLIEALEKEITFCDNSLKKYEQPFVKVEFVENFFEHFKIYYNHLNNIIISYIENAEKMNKLIENFKAKAIKFYENMKYELSEKCSYELKQCDLAIKVINEYKKQFNLFKGEFSRIIEYVDVYNTDEMLIEYYEDLRGSLIRELEELAQMMDEFEEFNDKVAKDLGWV